MSFVKTGLSKEPGEDQQWTGGTQRFSRCDPGQFVLKERCLNGGQCIVAGTAHERMFPNPPMRMSI